MQPRFRDVFEREEQQFFENLGYDVDQTIDTLHPDTQRAPLHDAAIEGNEKVVRQLLEQKVDVNQYHNSNDPENSPSGTPFLLAVYNNHLSVVKLLLPLINIKEQCNSKGIPVLSSAVYVGIEMLTILLKAGANADQEVFSEEDSEDNYMTALMYAASCAQMTAAELLIQYGASIKNSQNKSVFDYCFDEIVARDIKKYISHITSRTNELIERLKSVFPSSAGKREVIDIVASYTARGAYLKKIDPTYLSGIGLFNQRDESKKSERKVSDNRKYSDEKSQNQKEVRTVIISKGESVRLV